MSAARGLWLGALGVTAVRRRVIVTACATAMTIYATLAFLDLYIP